MPKRGREFEAEESTPKTPRASPTTPSSVASSATPSTPPLSPDCVTPPPSPKKDGPIGAGKGGTAGTEGRRDRRDRRDREGPEGGTWKPLPAQAAEATPRSSHGEATPRALLPEPSAPAAHRLHWPGQPAADARRAGALLHLPGGVPGVHNFATEFSTHARGQATILTDILQRHAPPCRALHQVCLK